MLKTGSRNHTEATARTMKTWHRGKTYEFITRECCPVFTTHNHRAWLGRNGSLHDTNKIQQRNHPLRTYPQKSYRTMRAMTNNGHQIHTTASIITYSWPYVRKGVAKRGLRQHACIHEKTHSTRKEQMVCYYAETRLRTRHAVLNRNGGQWHTSKNQCIVAWILKHPVSTSMPWGIDSTGVCRPWTRALRFMYSATGVPQL